MLPPYLIVDRDMETMRNQTVALAKALGVVGLINVQYAIKDGVVYVLEVNPRASRTIPFVSKAIGVPARVAGRPGVDGRDVGGDQVHPPGINPPYVSVKEAVFPFNKFAGTDPILGPEMRSTGEVMGISSSFGASFAKAQIAASNELPLDGTVLITVNDSDKPTVTPIARRFHAMGFDVVATTGTARYLRARGIPARSVFKIHEGRPNCLDLILNHDIGLLINTPLGKHAQVDDYRLRQAAITHRVSYTTTMSAAAAAGTPFFPCDLRGHPSGRSRNGSRISRVRTT